MSEMAASSAASAVPVAQGEVPALGEAKEEVLVTHAGGCHCGAVRWEATASSRLVAWDCLCSICRMKRNTHFIVPSVRFRLLRGEADLSTYTFGTHQAKVGSPRAPAAAHCG